MSRQQETNSNASVANISNGKGYHVPICKEEEESNEKRDWKLHGSFRSVEEIETREKEGEFGDGNANAGVREKATASIPYSLLGPHVWREFEKRDLVFANFAFLTHST